MTRSWHLPILWLALVSAVASPVCARTIGLFTSLPILWPEAGGIASMLRAMDKPHWAKAVLQRRGELRALDRLLPDKTGPSVPDLLVMIQPRPLAPDENAALDRWVRRGGRLLLFADPMLTADSAFVLGDRRRPQAIAMLQPLLAHWRLQLDFDAAQVPGERRGDVFGINLPVNLPGRLTGVGGGKSCAFAAQAIAAQCRIGKGVVLIVADAALFEEHTDASTGRVAALEALLVRMDGWRAGKIGKNRGETMGGK